MSTENAVGERSSTPKQARTSEPTTPPEPSSKGDGTQNSPPTPKLKDETKGDTQQEEGEADEGTTESGSLAEAASKPLVPARLLGEDSSRQVIAVSASKGPAAFFNLARKFLVTDEECDLSALEGAIVSAVDAAHLLERSKLATIVRVHTSYVTVEPKKKRAASIPEDQEPEGLSASGSSAEAPIQAASPQVASLPSASQVESSQSQASTPSSERSQGGRGSGGAHRELRRARIVITVRRSESYKRWLEENPLQAIIASDADETDPHPDTKDDP